MNEEQKEQFFDVLTKKVLYGLDDAEQRELDAMDPGTAATELKTLEQTAAAISLASVSEIEPMPSHLRAQILAKSHDHVGLLDTIYSQPRPVIATETKEQRRSVGLWFGWLGWVAAAAACIALAVNIILTRSELQRPDARAALVTPQPTPTAPTMAELRDRLAQEPNTIKATFAPGNVKDAKAITGDIVWNDAKQEGYMRFRNIPVNDAMATCYQLWIFDQVQDKATPIDGGIFDVTSDGELIVPIKAKLTAVHPEMFAITIERHGGVVVSKREKIAALAKVESQTS